MVRDISEDILDSTDSFSVSLSSSLCVGVLYRAHHSEHGCFFPGCSQWANLGVLPGECEREVSREDIWCGGVG